MKGNELSHEKVWWSKKHCPECKTILMACQHGKNGGYELTCESCWMELKSPFSDGVGDGQDTQEGQ